jgi:ADP-heptose:LPS heptosyltransferase
MKKILVIKHGSLRDFMHSCDSFQAIREHHAGDHITILTERQFFDFCKKSQLFNKGWIDIMPEWWDIKNIMKITGKIRKSKFDMVYDLQNDARSEWYFRLAGFKKPNWNSSVIDWCSHPNRMKKREKDKTHIIDMQKAQLQKASIEKFPKFDFNKVIDTSYADKFKLPKRYAVLCPAGSIEKVANKWHHDSYIDLAEYLETEHGIKSVLLGGSGNDFYINEHIVKNSVNAEPINFTSKTNLLELIAVCKRSLFCIGNETSPTHVATYSKTKTIMFCSRFSPSEIVAPKLKNLAVIEEPYLETIDLKRVIDSFEDFILPGLAHNEKGFKVMSEDSNDNNSREDNESKDRDEKYVNDERKDRRTQNESISQDKDISIESENMVEGKLKYEQKETANISEKDKPIEDERKISDQKYKTKNEIEFADDNDEDEEIDSLKDLLPDSLKSKLKSSDKK